MESRSGVEEEEVEVEEEGEEEVREDNLEVRRARRGVEGSEEEEAGGEGAVEEEVEEPTEGEVLLLREDFGVVLSEDFRSVIFFDYT